ncbi:uncharacterized protein [Rutidosis leptorrhynchoides]|uniref:uncharacterized protein n=1 Tax=Rutidosis leptorrhynchoides TaxID=125765 RepID=UPI003A9A312E
MVKRHLYLILYTKGDSLVDEVDRSLVAREEAISVLKFHLKRAQDHMKIFADRNRIDKEFMVDQWVYVKFQPYRQITIRGGKHHKLSPKFYGPFKILKRVGALHKGDMPLMMGIVPPLDPNGLLSVVTLKVLDKKLGKRGNAAAVYALVQWLNGSVEDARENYGMIWC